MKEGDYFEINGLTFEVIEIKNDLVMCKCISMDSPFRCLKRISLKVLHNFLGENFQIKIYTEEEKVTFLERVLKRNVWNIRGDD